MGPGREVTEANIFILIGGSRPIPTGGMTKGSLRSSLVPRVGLATIALLTPAVLLVHGYHPLADDGAVYVAGIKKLANPSLYQSDAVFASSPTHLSIFAHVLAPLLRWGSPCRSCCWFATWLRSFFFFSARGRWPREFSRPPRLLGSGVARCLLLHSSGRGHFAFHHGSLRHGAFLFHAAEPFRAGSRARRKMGGVLPLAGSRRAAASPDGGLYGDRHADACTCQRRMWWSLGLFFGLGWLLCRVIFFATRPCGSQPCI